MENVQKFYEALTKDKEMQKRAQKMNVTKPADEDAALAEIIAFAEKEGYSITASDVKEYISFRKTKKMGEISDDELDNVAGGGCGNSDSRCACIVIGAGGDCGCVFGGYGDGGNLCVLYGDNTLCTLDGSPGDPGYSCPSYATTKCTWG